MFTEDENDQPITFEWDTVEETTTTKEEKPTEDAVEPDSETPNTDGGADSGELPEEEAAEEESVERDGDSQQLPTDPTRVILEDLVSLGMASEDEVKDVSVENFYPFIQGLIERRVDTALEETIQGLDTKEQAALEFILSGGTVDELTEKYSVPKFNVKDDKGAIDFLRHYHKQEGLTDEEIDEKIDFYESRDNAQHYAEKYHAKWKSSQQDEKVNDLKKPKQNADEQRRKREQWKATVVSAAKQVEEYAGYQFDQTKKKELLNDLTINSVKTQDGQYASPFINNFFKVYNGADPKKLLLIAEILREDFKPELLVQRAETKGTQEVKTKLQKLAQSRSPQGSTVKEKAIWENF
jgi:hypothetical protein